MCFDVQSSFEQKKTALNSICNESFLRPYCVSWGANYIINFIKDVEKARKCQHSLKEDIQFLYKASTEGLERLLHVTNVWIDNHHTCLPEIKKIPVLQACFVAASRLDLKIRVDHLFKDDGRFYAILTYPQSESDQYSSKMMKELKLEFQRIISIVAGTSNIFFLFF